MDARSTGYGTSASPALLAQLLSLKQLRRTLRTSVAALADQRVLLWPHIGLGDLFTVVPAVEAWSAAVPQVLIPSKAANFDTTKDLYGYLDNVTVVMVPSGDSQEESEGIRHLARLHHAPIVDGGRSAYAWARDAFPEFGICRALNMALLYGSHDLVSVRFREHLSRLPQEPIPKTRYAFVDHHPGTHREIPAGVLRDVESRGLHLVHNPRGVPLLALASVMDEAHELHLVSSSPLCLALVANLGSGPRVRYQHYGLHPLKLDYPADWMEVSLAADGTVDPVDRVGDAVGFSGLALSLTAWLARRLFVQAAERLQAAAGTTS